VLSESIPGWQVRATARSHINMELETRPRQLGANLPHASYSTRSPNAWSCNLDCGSQ